MSLMDMDFLNENGNPPRTDNNIHLREMRRNQLHRSLMSHSQQLSQFDEMSLPQLEVKLAMVDRQFETFDQIQTQLELLDESQFQDNHREQFESIYFQVKSRIVEKITALKMEASDTLLSSTHVVSPSVASNKNTFLPKLQLSKFSGQHKEWLEFFNMFTTLVHNERELSAVAKFQYLRSCLTDNAARLIQSLEITPQNYLKALELLKARYDNKRSIFQSHVSDIFAIEKVSKPTTLLLRDFIDSLNSNLRALQSLATDQQIADGIILHLVISKLDSETQTKWEEEVAMRWERIDAAATELQLPTWETLSSFLERRCKTLDIIETNNAQQSKTNQRQITPPHQNRPKHLPSQVSFVAFDNKPGKCLLCDATPYHNAFKCSTFGNLQTPDRFNLIKSKKLCLNCFSATHIAGNCTSSHKCQHCRGLHHTLLHKQQPTSPPQTSEASTSKSSVSLKVSQSRSEVLLGTARVNMCSTSGISVEGRALLDSASQLNFITERMAQRLCLRRRKINIDISGISETTTSAREISAVVIKSLVNGYSSQIDVIVVPTITSYQPRNKVNVVSLNVPKNIKLADQSFGHPGPIDLLIGAELFYDLLLVGQVKIENAPTLQKTKLGWIVAGSTYSPSNSSATRVQSASQIISIDSILPYHSFTISASQSSLETILQNFWNIEHVTSASPTFSAEEEYCEHYFNKTTKRCPQSNKFIVRLPFKENPINLGESFEIARKRYSLLETKFARNNSLAEDYKKFIEEYIELQHMRLVTQIDFDQRYFIPHHCVVKPDSSTTRLRVVFDASCSTSNGKSLNDMLCVGPTIQNDIFNILSRFRFHKYVLVADIAKMYWQVLVDERDARWQSIIWRNTKTSSLSAYQLQTVTYGTSSAPYLATKCLNQLAQDESTSYKIGAAVVLNDFYVDNMMTGAETLDILADIKYQVTELLKSGGFPLRKFASNCEKIIEDVPIEDREDIIIVNNMQYIKALGLRWSPTEDVYSFEYRKQTSAKRTTKREILSHMASIFDPLGLLNPVVVKCKLLMQNLWSLKLNWDESVPQDTFSQWEHIKQQLEEVVTIKINRFVPFNATTKIHAFSDASTKAYGACIYAVTYSKDSSSSTLLCSKSRVAPLKQISLPRLELCAALLLSELLNTVIPTLPTSQTEINCWSDSTITLAWIAGHPSRWTTFVANRVTKIQALSSNVKWRHIPSTLNPADLLSRGSTTDALTNSNFWFSGPAFLQLPLTEWPTENTLNGNVEIEVRPSKQAFTTTVANDLISEHKFVNNYNKMVRTIAYVHRLISFSLKGRTESGSITAIEMNEALNTICRIIQQRHFKEDFNCLIAKGCVKRQSKLSPLTPFLHNNLIRVGGRLKNSSLSFDTKHPILLPSSHLFVRTLIRYFHCKHLHAGTLSLHNIIRDKFWIINARNVIKSVIHYCSTCFRCRPVTEYQIMGELPKERVEPSFPFEICGVDYCGPLLMTQNIRGRVPVKVYIAVFICFATKAVHLELVPDLSTAAFIASLKRFISRRGHCSTIFSDNATNFVGANRELKELLHSFLSEDHKNSVFGACREEGIKWKFIPPRSPHFGGLWESAVKQSKHYLRRTIGTHILNQDELHTVCCQAEAIINSRPLTPMSSDPNDLRTLTPAHFLIGRATTAIAEPSLETTNTSLLKKYQLVQSIHQQFWQRWSQEYLKTLQQRSKWTTTKANIQVDDLVLLKNENSPPLKWPLGRVIETILGRDNMVRVVVVKTSEGTYERAIAKVCKLPLEA